MSQPVGYQPRPPVDPRQAVKLPAMLLMGVGAFYIVVGLLLLVGNVILVAVAGKPIASMDSYSEAQMFYGVMGGTFTLLLGIPILLGAIRMKTLRSYSMAMTGVICAMIPCSCCFVIGVPLGIWAIIVLVKPEVKSAFQ